MIKSSLFTSKRVGPLVLSNRFMRSAVWEKLSDEQGNASQDLLHNMVDIARGGCGLVIPGYVYPQITGKACVGQTGMCSAKHAEAWRRSIKEIHSFGSKIIFQVCHAGVTSPSELIFDTPRGCSPFIPGSREMTIPEIEDTIQAFLKAAMLVEHVGGDGIQLHGSHGYLLSAFLSPAMNKRKDKYGGSRENRLRIVKEIVQEIRSITSPAFMLSIKLNSNDCIEGGMTPELCAENINDLKKDIDLFEISCGFTNSMTTIRSNIYYRSLFKNATPKDKEILQRIIDRRDVNYQYSEGYNVAACKVIKNKVPGATLAVVGGNRNVKAMESIIDNNIADIVSLGRPFIREPNLVRHLYNGAKQVECISCGECSMKSYRDGPVRCHFPKIV